MQDQFQIKNCQLNEFIANRVVSCEQRTEAWHNLRKNSFGGSELAALMGQCNNNYINQQKFLVEKAEKRLYGKDKQFELSAQIIMDWGTFFEPVHRHVMEAILQREIVETSLAQGNSYMQGCHQSPDGLATIDTKTFMEHIRIPEGWQDYSIFEQSHLNVLFEQKSPARRVPTGEIPKQYIGQVKLGLSVFDVCDVGCYTESIFQLCTADQMFNKYQNNKIIIKRRDKISHPDPSYVGVMILDTEWIKQYPRLSELGTGDISKFIEPETFVMLTEGIKSGNAKNQILSMRYSKTGKSGFLKQIPVGKSYVCWKLLYLDMVAVEHSQGFSLFTSMFINLGQTGLQDCLSVNCSNSQKFKMLEVLGGLGLSTKMPLTPENQQDKWFKYNKYFFVDFCLNNMVECESKYVIITAILIFDIQEKDINQIRSYLQKITTQQQFLLTRGLTSELKDILLKTCDIDQMADMKIEESEKNKNIDIEMFHDQMQITTEGNVPFNQDSMTNIVQTQEPQPESVQ